MANHFAGEVFRETAYHPIANRRAGIAIIRSKIGSISGEVNNAFDQSNVPVIAVTVYCRNHDEIDWGPIINDTFPVALRGALEYFNFGHSVRGRVRVLLENIRTVGGETRTLVSDARIIYPNNEHTARSLSHSLDMKYAMAGGDNFGSGANFQMVAFAEPYEFRAVYQFHFTPTRRDPEGLHMRNRVERGAFARTYNSRSGDRARPFTERTRRDRPPSLINRMNARTYLTERARENAFRYTPEIRRNISIARLNAVRRANNAGNPTHTGAGSGLNTYAQLKSKMYIRRTLGDIFSYSKALKATPETEQELCFPMAFMMCQRRTVLHSTLPNGQVSREVSSIEEGGCDYIKIDPEGEIPDFVREEEVSFLDLEEGVLKLFDCSKEAVEGTPLYENELESYSETKKRIWLWCAANVHLFVERICGEEIDPNNLEACLEAYSAVFVVNISVFSFHDKGERISITSPLDNDSPAPEEERFVCMLMQGSHMHAISNVRDYFKSEVNAKRTCIHSFCDYCGTLSLKRTKNFNHQNKCVSTNKWMDKTDVGDIYSADLRPKPLTMGGKGAKPMCTLCKQFQERCKCSDPTPIMVPCTTCTICNVDVPRNHYNHHECYMQPKKVKEPLDEATLFVWDMECVQDYNAELGQYVHECALICIRAIYDERRWYFKTVKDFVCFLLEEPQMSGATLLAHNGGGYDDQFILRYVEDNAIPHSTVPRPNSLHKFLRLTLLSSGTQSSIHFIDFMMLMTNSLKNIGKAFKLDVCKGDFPHNFSRKENLDYIGPLPDLNHPSDYYGFKTIKSADDLKETREYWESQKQVYCTCIANVVCNCTKKKWDFQEELLKYCWLDVDVLAGACKAYRDQALSFGEGCSMGFNWTMPNKVDPFHCMTQSQVALTLFTAGKSDCDIAISRERMRDCFRPEQVKWIEYQASKNPEYEIRHAGNYHKEWYDVDTASHVTGYCRRTRTIFEYYDCLYYGCPTCYADKRDSDELHPTRKIPWKYVMAYTEQKQIKLRFNNVYDQVVVHWSHNNHIMDDFPWDPEVGNLMPIRSIFYGGRTEVFSAFCNPGKLGMKVQYDDVCSLYPYICSYRDLPTGIHKVYLGSNIDRSRLDPNREDRYFGYVRAKIKPNKQDIIGVLPNRRDGKLCYDLMEKIGCWHTEFIYLALSKGYEILDVYEVWDWEASQRTDKSMRGYMEFFLRMKQEAEGWGKLGQDLYRKEELKDPTDEMKDKICDYIEQCNGGMARPRWGCVEVNPVKRQLAKIFLNCLWGKLAQKNPTELEISINGYSEYLKLINNSSVQQDSIRFRYIGGSCYKARYKAQDSLVETNPYINVYMAASVTAHAQILLMRQMFVVKPERVLYCDTDSIIYLRKEDDPSYTKSGLGNWADEFPGKNILKYLALAPKSYVMNVEDDDDVFKCKGVRTTETNRELTKVEDLEKLVNYRFFGDSSNALATITAETMTIHPNSTNSLAPYGTLLTRYGYKDIRTVYSKRELCINTNPEAKTVDDMALIRLVPFGYEGSETHVYSI